MVCKKCSRDKSSRESHEKSRTLDCLQMWKIFGVVVTIIVLYWILLLYIHGSEEKSIHGDPMNKILFELPFLENCCSAWPVSHFILFTIIGFLFPDCDAMAISAGIGWELIEVGVYHALGKSRQGVRRSGKVEYSSSWWMGSTKDIFMNIAGFYTGKLIFSQSQRRCTCKDREQCD